MTVIQGSGNQDTYVNIVSTLSRGSTDLAQTHSSFYLSYVWQNQFLYKIKVTMY